MNPLVVTDDLAIQRARFASAWRAAGARSAPDFSEIATRYAEPQRAYHTLGHVRNCLQWFALSRQLAEHPAEVELALVYHDVVYYPERSDNEQRSAELFRSHAQPSELPREPTARIAALIEGTATRHADTRDGALVNDIDLAVLASTPEEFARYEARIREEYRHVDEWLFRVGRERILRSFLQAASIYASRFYRERMEAQARKNLLRSLAALRKHNGKGVA